jgi:hypothetical protein
LPILDARAENGMTVIKITTTPNNLKNLIDFMAVPILVFIQYLFRKEAL